MALFGKAEIDREKDPCSLTLYFKSGNAITLENVTAWEMSNDNKGLTKLNVNATRERGKPTTLFINLNEIEAVTETYP